jgi:uncharacterized membrane protein YbjE (DUF340 family)
MPRWLSFVLGPDCAPIRYFLYTVCGATCLYLFSLSKGFEGSVPVLRRLLPNRPSVFYDRVDFLIVIVLGSIVGTVFFVPVTPAQALAAGFGWVSAVNVLSASPRTAATGADHDH